MSVLIKNLLRCFVIPMLFVGMVCLASEQVPALPTRISELRVIGAGDSNLVFLENGKLAMLLAHPVAIDGAAAEQAVYAEWDLGLDQTASNVSIVTPAEKGASPLNRTILLPGGQGTSWISADRHFGARAVCAGDNGTIHRVEFEPDFIRYTCEGESGVLLEEKIPSSAPVATKPFYDFPDFLQLTDGWSRDLGIARATDGTLHVVYSLGRTEELVRDANDVWIGTKVWSGLYLATKKPGGQWTSRSLLQPPANGFGDYGGLGASIAVAPDGEIGVSASVVPRVPTGSPQKGRLVFAKFQADAEPRWQTVDSSPAGYVAGDGDMGTGLFPKLQFDNAGRAHLVYTDHASEHFPDRGAQCFSGQIRYARQKADFSGWDWFAFLSRSGVKARDNQVFRPSLTVHGNGTAVVAANVHRRVSEKSLEYYSSEWETDLFLRKISPEEPGNFLPPPPASASPVASVASPVETQPAKSTSAKKSRKNSLLTSRSNSVELKPGDGKKTKSKKKKSGAKKRKR